MTNITDVIVKIVIDDSNIFSSAFCYLFETDPWYLLFVFHGAISSVRSDIIDSFEPRLIDVLFILLIHSRIYWVSFVKL